MSAVREQYEAWLDDPAIDEQSKQELRGIAGDDKEIEDRFYRELEFGTGGMRGVIGAGTNRMNVYTVGKATEGLARFVLEQYGPGSSVAIAYDSRNMSPEFALESALVLAASGIKAYVFESLRPTPELSFAVRELGASAGIVVTASHNPPEYNGYKVYGPDGCQLVPHLAELLMEQIRGIASFREIKRVNRQEAESRGLLQWLGSEMDEKYWQAVAAVSQRPEAAHAVQDRFKVVYTPLHGSGNVLVRGALERIGVQAVHVVPEQEKPDALFSTVKSPNPEEKEAFAMAMELGDRVGADILIGTDPDCDRMGAVVKNRQGEYEVLTGNQSGALLIHYMLSAMKEQSRLPDRGVVIKTIVTSEMGAVVAESFGLEVMNTLTGFKYIGEKMTQFEAAGDRQFVFGYEESYGYLAGTHCRDKDAVVASMLICEAAAYYKSQGKSLYDVLYELYEHFGYFYEHLESRTLKGKDGLEQIRAIMDQWRSAPPGDVGGVRVVQVLDYSKGLDGLPPENVMKYVLEDGSWFCLRPSGTEPKIKVYFAVRQQGEAAARERLALIRERVMAAIDG